MGSNEIIRFLYVGPLRVSSQIEKGPDGPLIGTLGQINLIAFIKRSNIVGHVYILSGKAIRDGRWRRPENSSAARLMVDC